MNHMSPIQGISLERYAELSADVTDCINDPEQCAKIVEAQGVARADWEAAHQGWLARMQDMALMGSVATAYMPLYQAALAKRKGTVSASFEDYVAISGVIKAWGIQRGLAHYGLDMAMWTQIAGTWNNTMAGDMYRYQGFGPGVEQEGARIAAGGQPRPVTIARQAGGAGGGGGGAAVPGAQISPQQQMENQMMAQAVNANVNAHIAAAQAQAAAAYGQAAQNVGFLGRGALGVMGFGSIAAGIGPGMAVMVQWSDGNRYPAKCVQVGGGQVCVAFGDGRQMWVPESAVSKQ
jgi:hypothetical protein